MTTNFYYAMSPNAGTIKQSTIGNNGIDTYIVRGKVFSDFKLTKPIGVFRFQGIYSPKTKGFSNASSYTGIFKIGKDIHKFYDITLGTQSNNGAYRGGTFRTIVFFSSRNNKTSEINHGNIKAINNNVMEVYVPCSVL